MVLEQCCARRWALTDGELRHNQQNKAGVPSEMLLCDPTKLFGLIHAEQKCNFSLSNTLVYLE